MKIKVSGINFLHGSSDNPWSYSSDPGYLPGPYKGSFKKIMKKAQIEGPSNYEYWVRSGELWVKRYDAGQP